MLVMLLIGIGLPGVLSALGSLFLWRHDSRIPVRWRAAPVAGLLVLAILIADLFARAGRLALWPPSGADRFPHAALLLFGMCTLPVILGARAGARIFCQWAGAVVAPHLILGTISPPRTISVVMVIIIILSEFVVASGATTGGVGALLLAAGCAAEAVVFYNSGNAYFAHLAATLGAALAGAGIAALFRRTASLGAEISWMAGSLIILLAAAAREYTPADIPMLHLLLPMIAIPAALVVRPAKRPTIVP